MSEATVYRWLVSGRVQGVAFRWFTAETAHRLKLRGTVRNLADGRVEILLVDPAVDGHREVQGHGDEALASFRAAVKQGPSAARVDGIEEADVSPSEAAAVVVRQGFDIVY